MRENVKPKIMVGLSSLTFGLSALIMALISPVERWLRVHPWPDRQIAGGHNNQYRQIGDDGPKFYLYLWSAEVSCSSAMIGCIVYVVLVYHLIFTGWNKLIRKVRNPAGLHSQDDVALRRASRFPSLKMIFFHPRVIISIHLLLVAAIAVVAAMGLYISNGTSDTFDAAKADAGEDLGAFTLETYTCHFLPYYARDNATMVLDFHEKCMLMKSGRLMVLATACVAVIGFFFGVWALDSISQPVEAQSEHQRVLAWLEQRRHANNSNLVMNMEARPNIERIASRF